MKNIIALLIGILPFNHLRIAMYRLILQYKISFDSHIGWGNFLCCNKVIINKGYIGHFNRINCNILTLEEGARIKRLNSVKLINSFYIHKEGEIVSRNGFIGLFQDWYKHREDCNVTLGEKSLITINNYLDATRKIEIGKNVVIGGKDTQIWTHGFDIYRNMVTGPVIIGNDIYIGARCTICQGVTICDQTVIGAATCVSKSINESGFYISSSLIRKSDIKVYSEDIL